MSKFDPKSLQAPASILNSRNQSVPMSPPRRRIIFGDFYDSDDDLPRTLTSQAPSNGLVSPSEVDRVNLEEVRQPPAIGNGYSLHFEQGLGDSGLESRRSSIQPFSDRSLTRQIPPPLPSDRYRIASQGHNFASGINTPSTPYGPTAFNQINTPPMLYPSNNDDFDGVIDYLMLKFGDLGTADVVINICIHGPQTVEGQFFTHELLIRRSPKLRQLLNTLDEQSGLGSSGRSVINIRHHDNFLSLGAFELALLRLYGGPLVDSADMSCLGRKISTLPLQYTNFELHVHSHVDSMSFVLAYAAAGHYLQLSSVRDRSLHLIVSLINWNNLEQLISFATDGGLSESWSDRASSHLDDGLGITTERTVRSAGPKYGPLSDAILNEVVEFIIHNFAPQVFHDFGTDSMQFGDHTQHVGQVPALPSPGEVLRKIVVIMPFPLLQVIFNSQKLGGGYNAVNPEERRVIIENMIATRSLYRLAEQEEKRGEVGTWHEFAEDINRLGFSGVQLSRKWLARGKLDLD